MNDRQPAPRDAPTSKFGLSEHWTMDENMFYSRDGGPIQ